MISCECTCKAGRSRKCPHALALLYLIDNYNQVGTDKPKIKLGGNHHSATRSPWLSPSAMFPSVTQIHLQLGRICSESESMITFVVLLMVATNQTIGIKWETSSRQRSFWILLEPTLLSGPHSLQKSSNIAHPRQLLASSAQTLTLTLSTVQTDCDF